MNTATETRDQRATFRVAIVEDNPHLRDFFVEQLGLARDLDIAGTASSVESGLDLCRLDPDIFLVDIGLPDGSGLDLIPRIAADCEAKALVLTSFGDRQTVLGAIRAGADGYILKDTEIEEILTAIRRTLAGEAPISPAAATYILEDVRTHEALVEADIAEDQQLNARETELLDLFARGLSYKEAAAQMGISPLTVGNYVKSVYGKLQVNSRSEAVYEALKTGQLKI